MEPLRAFEFVCQRPWPNQLSQTAFCHNVARGPPQRQQGRRTWPSSLDAEGARRSLCKRTIERDLAGLWRSGRTARSVL